MKYESNILKKSKVIQRYNRQKYTKETDLFLWMLELCRLTPPKNAGVAEMYSLGYMTDMKNLFHC